MQKIIIEVKDDYINNVVKILQSMQGIMINKIKLGNDNKIENDFIKLQIPSMEKTWENEEDKVWDEL